MPLQLATAHTTVSDTNVATIDAACLRLHCISYNRPSCQYQLRSRAHRKGTALPRPRIVFPSRPHELPEPYSETRPPPGHLGTLFDMPNRIGAVYEVWHALFGHTPVLFTRAVYHSIVLLYAMCAHNVHDHAKIHGHLTIGSIFSCSHFGSLSSIMSNLTIRSPRIVHHTARPRAWPGRARIISHGVRFSSYFRSVVRCSAAQSTVPRRPGQSVWAKENRVVKRGAQTESC
jgi:hypothetical protein